MAGIQKRKVYAPLNGGLNDTLSPTMIQDTEAAELLNCQVSDRAILEKIKGYAEDHSPFPDDADSFIRMLVNYRRGLSVNDLVMAARDDGNTNATYKVDLKKTNGDGTSAYIGHTAGTSASFTNGNTAVTGVGTSWSSHLKAGDKIKATSHDDAYYGEIQTVVSDTSLTLTAGYGGATAAGVAYTARIVLDKDTIPNATVFNNNLIITNGSETPMTWNNTTLNKITDTDCPKADLVTSHKNRVFMAATDGYPSRVFWSAVNDEQSWDAAGYEDIYPQDNGSIIAIKSFGDSLVVLKNNGKVYQMVGNFDQDSVGEADFIRLVDSPENIGTIAARTVVVHNSYLYFLAESGLYRIDQRMAVEKATRNADVFLSDVSFAAGPTSLKAHQVDESDQWDDGTLSGVVVRSGTLHQYFDEYTVTDAKKYGGLVASVIDVNNKVHVAYVDSSNGAVVKYAAWDSSGTKTSETVCTGAGTILDLSIAVNSAGTPAIAFTTGTALSPTSSGIYERTGGVWTQDTNLVVSGSYLALKYTGSDDPRLAVIFLGSSSNSTCVWWYRTGGVWASRTIAEQMSTVYPPSLVIDGSGSAHVAWSEGTTLERYASSADDFATKTDKTFATTARPTWARHQIHVNNSNQALSLLADDGKIKEITWSGTPGSSNLVPTTDNLVGGLLYNNNRYYVHFDSSGTESFYFNGSTTVVNSTTGTLATSDLMVGANTFSSNGVVFAYAYFGASGDEVVVRRIAPISVYTSAEFSDSTLSAWGEYSIQNQSTGGATVAHTIALDSAPGPSSYAAISDGQVISTNAALIYAKFKISSTITGWAGMSVGGVFLKYTGTGVNAKAATAASFQNQLYIATATVADNNNTTVLVLDEDERLLKAEYPVSVFEAYRNQLYAGRSSNGDLIKLRTGYAADGSAYGMDFQSKEDFLEGIELKKSIYKFYVLYEVRDSGTFTFSYRTDSFATVGGSTWSTSTVDMTEEGVAEIPVGVTCRSIQFRVTDSSSSANPAIIAVVLVYGNLNIR